jgi:L-lactate dehydrogenase (cytochrome)
MVLSEDEVSRHNTRSSCWVIIRGEVYDMTDFLDQHPAGPEIILKYAGRDATEEFVRLLFIVKNAFCQLGRMFADGEKLGRVCKRSLSIAMGCLKKFFPRKNGSGQSTCSESPSIRWLWYNIKSKTRL